MTHTPTPMFLQVYRDGRAVVSKKLNTDALLVAKGSGQLLKSCCVSGCRLSYNGKDYLVNGVPEADTESEALEAVLVFRQRCEWKLAGLNFFTGAKKVQNA